LASEIEELRFVRAFRQVMRAQNTLSCFADFSFEDLGISEQEYLDYRSKYLDLYEKANSSDKEKASALEDVDFELELMHRDIINVAYILNLLSMLVDAKGENYENKKKQISDMLSNDIHMRSKKELIEEFIEDNLVHIKNSEDVADAFDSYWSEQQLKAFTKLCEDENLDSKKIEAIIEEHLFANQVPALRDKVMKSMLKKESLLVRKKTIPSVIDKIMDFINTFIDGVAA
jgi:type I restriction enzyme R subunit